ncbi:MAG: aspartate aminotransferase family protein [Methanobrevibacter sp.]|uniref:aspartate aminotransferase family protein n=1 Tax=Methanobrevibacter sp. TaxID=66852 RepID=UPI0026DF7970|nr:aspartate aminotransferase family protein [Methanobrevibacter sp.]MDO5848606.1 aspartate aminotransferase family protein [Methanobrevibacter sp.]
MNTKELMEAEDEYFVNTFTRQPIVLDHGEGLKVWDTEGKEYLDFFAGIAVNCLGHKNPRVVDAISKQAEKLIHISNIYYNEPAIEFAKRLVDLTCFDKIFYTNSGAESNEGAIKLALKYTGKSEIITTTHSFHGRTLLTVTATGQEKYKAPYVKNLPQGFIEVPYNDIGAIKEAISDETAAIIVEPIQGEGGVNIPNDDYLPEIEKLCKENGIVFIVDEVQTGFGRCGPLFAHEIYGVKPDIMSVAKGIGGGVPMGAFLATEEVARGFEPGDHGTTFGGGPLVCASANAVLDVLYEDDLLTNCVEMGAYLSEKLVGLMDNHDIIKEVRGFGLLIGVELNKEGGEFVDIMREKGFLVNCTAGNVLRFAPPLTVTKEEIDKLIVALDEVL